MAPDLIPENDSFYSHLNGIFGPAMHRRAAWPVKSPRGGEAKEKCGVTAIVGEIINADKKKIFSEISPN